MIQASSTLDHLTRRLLLHEVGFCYIPCRGTWSYGDVDMFDDEIDGHSETTFLTLLDNLAGRNSKPADEIVGIMK